MSTRDNQISPEEMDSFNRQVCNPLPENKRSRRNFRQQLPDNPTKKFERFGNAARGLVGENETPHGVMMERACAKAPKREQL